jgi:hypothetical protein
MLKLRPETDELLYDAAGKAGLTKSEFVERAIHMQVAVDPTFKELFKAATKASIDTTKVAYMNWVAGKKTSSRGEK